ncbi:maleylpyruvate isomerase family mycothiol-dependent enzyme [Gordonia sputi]
MPLTVVDKDSITAALTAEWSALRSLAVRLTDEQWSAPSVLPGWTNADIVAHIIGTESMLDGRDVDAADDITSRTHVKNPIGELNERWADHFRDKSREEVLSALDEIIEVRTAALTAMTQDEFDAQTATPAGPDTYGRFMRIRVFDCWIHEVDLRDALAYGSPSDPVTAGVALDEISSSLPFVVGKRASAPDGSRVRFDITGVAPREVRVAVDGRAGLVESFDGGDDAADVTLRVDGVDLARLAGGRRNADPSAVIVTGDEALAKAVLDRIDYVI